MSLESTIDRYAREAVYKAKKEIDECVSKQVEARVSTLVNKYIKTSLDEAVALALDARLKLDVLNDERVQRRIGEITRGIQEVLSKRVQEERKLIEEEKTQETSKVEARTVNVYEISDGTKYDYERMKDCYTAEQIAGYGLADLECMNKRIYVRRATFSTHLDAQRTKSILRTLGIEESRFFNHTKALEWKHKYMDIKLAEEAYEAFGEQFSITSDYEGLEYDSD